MRSVPCIVLAAACLLALAGCSEKPQAGPDTTASELRVFVDPTTGEIIEPPAAAASKRAALPEAANPAVSTSHEGLKTRPGTTAAGGVILDLNGRFQDELRVTTAPDGSKTTCNHGEAKPDQP